MHLRYALLTLLLEGETHGYQLLKRFTAQLGPFWQPNIGQVYQLLQELAQRGFVTSREERAGTRHRRLVRITTRGERALHTWLARRPGWPPPLRDEIFIRCLAAEPQGPAAVLEQLARQEAEYRRYLELVDEEAGRAGSALMRRLAHELARGQAEAYLHWLGRCRELLQAPTARLAS